MSDHPHPIQTVWREICISTWSIWDELCMFSATPIYDSQGAFNYMSSFINHFFWELNESLCNKKEKEIICFLWSVMLSCIFQSPKKQKDTSKHKDKVSAHPNNRSHYNSIPNKELYFLIKLDSNNLELISIYKLKDQQHSENIPCL